MSKRELGQLAAVDENLEDSRTKRRKEVTSPNGQENGLGVGGSGPVKDQCIQLWQTVKDASKDGRQLSFWFQRKPNKRQLPEYYKVITHPIALDDIHSGIDTGQYPTLESVRDALDLCFNNAKQYNKPGSEIYDDAKELQKLTHKVYSKLQPPSAQPAEQKDSAKSHNLYKILKSTMHELLELADDTGRLFSPDFKELPNRNDAIGPLYYQTIQNPQCLETINKKIKRKEYKSIKEFADDVELVFSNAMLFNQDDSQIYEDAKTLKEHFRKQMNDLPPEFALPSRAKQKNGMANGKIKIKPQAGSSASVPVGQARQIRAPANKIERAAPDTNGVLMLRAGENKPTLAASSSFLGLPKMTNTHVPLPPPKQHTLPSVQPIPTPTYSHTVPYGTNNYYPNASYNQHQFPQTPTPVHSSISPPAPTPSARTSQTPARPEKFPIKSATLRTKPGNRLIPLSHHEGVKVWMIRLDRGDESLVVRDVIFLETGTDEDESEEDEDEESGDESAMDVDEPSPRKRGRGRPPRNLSSAKAAKGKNKATRPKKAKEPRIAETLVKLNSVVTSENEEEPGVWEVDLTAGTNTLEIGEKEGMVWKVYLERRESA